MISSLPVFSIVFGAYVAVFSNLGTLIRAIFLPLLLLIIVGMLEEAASAGLLLSFVFWVLGLPLVALIAVACHRIVLLGPDSLDNPWSLFWSGRESSFLVWLVILTVFLFIAALVFNLVFLVAPGSVFGYRTPWLGGFLTIIAVTYLEGRFGMVLPATALGKSMILSNSWYLTAGNGLRLAIALLTPTAIVVGLIVSLNVALVSRVPKAFVAIAVLLLSLTFVVEIAVLSLSYKFLRDAAQGDDNQ